MNYLYGENKVNLPDIFTVYTPEMQKTHPFAVMATGDDGYSTWHPYRLYCCKELPHITSAGKLVVGSLLASSIKYVIYPPDHNLPGWNRYGITAVETQIDPSCAFWSNHDILDENGNVVLAASDPVPVPQLNPAALMQGFATMLSLRRNRNG